MSHPELEGYEPGDGRPLRSRGIVTGMRVLVIVGIVALILPGIVVTATTASSTADRSCAIALEQAAPGLSDYQPRFELFSPAGVGWNCYAVEGDGDEILIATMGIIPGAPHLGGQ